uniref:Uncharacterized protein n=1 Tax=Timema cristinae TaxID=61476 RepID=A0A7R9CEB4_TIMCR|nr:unnamed protein product [Timema cristinae]
MDSSSDDYCNCKLKKRSVLTLSNVGMSGRGNADYSERRVARGMLTTRRGEWPGKCSLLGEERGQRNADYSERRVARGMLTTRRGEGPGEC